MLAIVDVSNTPAVTMMFGTSDGDDEVPLTTEWFLFKMIASYFRRRTSFVMTISLAIKKNTNKCYRLKKKRMSKKLILNSTNKSYKER